MGDLVLTCAIRSPEEYAAARERLKRLRASPDIETVADIVALQHEVAKYESAQMILGRPTAPDDEHAQYLGIG